VEYEQEPISEESYTQSNEHICAGCNQIVQDSTAIEALKKIWHIDHFKCTQCKKSLPNSFHAISDQPYCDNCYFDKFKCGKCNRRIEDLYVPLNNSVYHSDCLANKCKICNKNISGSSVKILDEYYHPNCFTCSSCFKVLSTEYYEKDNRPICGDCAYSGEEIGATSSAKSCTRCSLPLSGKYVEALGNRYHPECLVCSSCSTQLGMQFLELNGKPICQNCMHKCYTCGKSITGKYVEAFDQKYHQGCFTCHKCKIGLQDDYFDVNGKPTCESCA